MEWQKVYILFEASVASKRTINVVFGVISFFPECNGIKAIDPIVSFCSKWDAYQPPILSGGLLERASAYNS